MNKNPLNAPQNNDSADDASPISRVETGSAGHVQQWHVTHALAGQRLDATIALRLNQSRQQVKTLLEQGAVTLNGKVAGVSRKGLLLPAGTMIAVTLPDAQGQWSIQPQPELPLTILAQGSGHLVLDKPAGMPVHPLTPQETGTLLNAVVARFPQVQGVGEAGLRSGVVHRLDVETSGAIIVATEHERWLSLRQAFASHQTRKQYTAIVAGHPAEEGLSRAHLTIAQHRPARVKVLEKAGNDSRWCDLSWRLTKRLVTQSVLDITLGTGFLHQIRVMMAALGYPVVGDQVYGHPGGIQPPLRLMLHARELEIGDIHAHSPLPALMREYIEKHGP